MNWKANQPPWANAVTVPGEVVGLGILQDCILTFKINWFYSCIIYIKEKHRSGVYSFMSLVDWRKKKRLQLVPLLLNKPFANTVLRWLSAGLETWSAQWDIGTWDESRTFENTFTWDLLAYISWKPLNHNCLKKAKLACWMMINMWSTHLFCSSWNLTKHHKCECDHLRNLV